MYSTEIENLLRADKKFIGVFPRDKVVIHPKRKEYYMIVNTQATGSVGEHWQLIYVKDGNCYFFCSLGRKPHKSLRKLLTMCYDVYFNRNRPQESYEVTCGGYTIFVANMLRKGHKFEDVCEFFNVITHDDSFIRYFTILSKSDLLQH